MLQLKLSQPQQPISSHLAAKIPTHCLHMSKYETGQVIEPFIEQFEMVATTYKLREAIRTVEFMNLFDGKPLDLIHRLDTAMRDYKGNKKALLAYGMTVEDACEQYQRAMLQDNETVTQFCARLRRYLEQWMEKDETPRTVEYGSQEEVVEEAIN
ncbi:hypothetical protein E2C01_075246 [Portunus trituberculatus]|uniref:Retrotransposon gag domain-containing protein n=1 Tax=Portunus trituberculatus TaxID=210409 RepID=A0A5B7I817_PORTR|nr:hypothetical protein [Portunus trituberculatus]